jgi:SHS2 domain-containing protein
MPFHVTEHTADVGFHVEAETREALFEEAAAALTALLVDDPDTVRARERRELRLPGDDDAYLLFDLLHELLLLFELDRWLVARLSARLEGNILTARLEGEPIDPERHHLAHEIKAITYHGFGVRRSDGGWAADVLVDV